ncbi:choline transporter-like protein [Fragilaria crotonensis]|nr:choline transporter-like protein [Fragilaria crotonensis]
MNIASGSNLEDGVPVTGHHIHVKGEMQPSEYRDAWATVLFLIQCLAMVGVAVAYFPYIGQVATVVSANTTTATTPATTTTPDLSDDLTNNTDADDGSWLDVLSLVKMSLFFAPVTFLAIYVILLPSGDGVATVYGVLALVSSIVTICCWAFYKKHIAFAAANLQSALTALKFNSATYGLAFLFSIMSFVAMIVWVIAIAGVQSKSDLEGQVSCAVLHKDDDSVVYQPGQMCDTHPPNPALMIALLLGFYWTQQVIKNVVHVTTAGVVGSWWFAPMGDLSSSCCCCTSSHPNVIASSLSRAMTYSFGSICLGSLLVSIMEVLKSFARSSNRNGRDISIVGCILECVLYCIRDLLEYFNSWAFVYVGLYGYPYIEAGKNVMNLFRQRGWTTLIADRLVFRVLLFCNLGVAAICGLFAILCDMAVGGFFVTSSSDLSTSHGIAFVFAFLVGLFISNVALFVVESAVRTVIVCFAESPAEFEEHHPELYEVMKAGWAEAYPTVPGVWA